MTIRIATAGKGGVGKTTFTALLARYLIDSGHKPLLVVDADPNCNLNEYLMAKVHTTIADIREDVRQENIPAGISKNEYIERRIYEAISENNSFDLITMGRPEGPGCYCFVNEILRTFLSRLSKKYEAVVIDNEAGLEHLSRRTSDNLDYLFIVSDTNVIGLKTSLHIKKLATTLNLKIKNISLVLNRVNSKNDIHTAKEIIKDAMEIKAVIPEIPTIASGDLLKKGVFNFDFSFDIFKNLV